MTVARTDEDLASIAEDIYSKLPKDLDVNERGMVITRMMAKSTDVFFDQEA